MFLVTYRTFWLTNRVSVYNLQLETVSRSSTLIWKITPLHVIHIYLMCVSIYVWVSACVRFPPFKKYIWHGAIQTVESFFLILFRLSIKSITQPMISSIFFASQKYVVKRRNKRKYVSRLTLFNTSLCSLHQLSSMCSHLRPLTLLISVI